MHYQEDFVLRKYFFARLQLCSSKRLPHPYKKVCYHVKEFDGVSPPMNAKELFNLRHSSLRISVERAFRVLKKRFRRLDAEPFWEFK